MTHLKKSYLTFLYPAVIIYSMMTLSPLQACDTDDECLRGLITIMDAFDRCITIDREGEEEIELNKLRADVRENAWARKCLDYPCPHWFKPAIKEYQPFIDIEADLTGKNIANICGYGFYNLKEEALKLWSEAEHTQTEPLLKAVCIFQQLKRAKTYIQKFDLIDRLVTQFTFTSTALVETPKFALNAKILAAKETSKSLPIARKFRFEPDRQEPAVRLAHLINQSAELWEAVAKESENPKIPAVHLYYLLPTLQDDEDSELGLDILYNPTKYDIKNPICNSELKYVWESAEGYKERQACEAPVNEIIRLSFQALCFYKAASYSQYHYMHALKQTPGISFLVSQSDDLRELIRRAELSASSIAALVIKHVDAKAKLNLCVLSAEQMAQPFRQGSSKLDFGAHPNMSDQAKMVFFAERAIRKPFLEKMYNEALIYADQVPQTYENRISILQAHIGIAMLTDDDQKKRESISTAFDLSRFEAEELDTACRPPEVYRYNPLDACFISTSGQKLRIQGLSQ